MSRSGWMITSQCCHEILHPCFCLYNEGFNLKISGKNKNRTSVGGKRRGPCTFQSHTAWKCRRPEIDSLLIKASFFVVSGGTSVGQFLLEKVSGSESKGTEVSCKRGVERGRSLSLAISPSFLSENLTKAAAIGRIIKAH